MPAKVKSAKITITVPAKEKKEWEKSAAKAKKSLAAYIAESVKMRAKADIKLADRRTDLEVLKEGMSKLNAKSAGKLKGSTAAEDEKSLYDLIEEYVKAEE